MNEHKLFHDEIDNKFSILFMLSDNYMTLAKIFLNSLFKNCNMKLINKIIIGNIGLSGENKKFIETSYSKIEIFDDVVNVYSSEIHSPDWIKGVSRKTKILLDYISKIDETIILMDVDMINFHDFSHVIDKQYDIQVCRRHKPASKYLNHLKSSYMLNYIASFLIVNSKKAISFIENWINNITFLVEQRDPPGYETPALCLVIEQFKEKIKIGELKEKIVSCDNNYFLKLTCVVHMKSKKNKHLNTDNLDEDEKIKKHLMERIRSVKNVDHSCILKLIDEVPN